MEDKLKQDVEAIVKLIFSEKEDSDVRKKTEEALHTSATTIDELTGTLEVKNTEVADLEVKISDFEEKTTALESELEAAKTGVETSKAKLEEAEKKIEEMLKDKATEVRMAELEKAGILRKDRETQAAKVREMSDEDFVSYKDELASIREAVLAEMKAAEINKDEDEDSKKEAAEAAAAKEAEEKAAAEAASAAGEGGEEGGEDGEVDTHPANIDPGQAVSAALNMEVFPSKDMVSKYTNLGKALAESYTKDK